MNRAMPTHIDKQGGTIIVTGAFGLSRLLAISYWLLARKVNAKSQ